MSKLISIVAMVAVLCVVGMEAHQVYATCLCMCSASSGVPSSLNVNDTGNCDRDFSYTFKAHFATNDDSGCSSGIGGHGGAYANASYSDHMQNHSISPTSFTIVGDGHTQSFTVLGELDNEDLDGLSAVTAYEDTTLCSSIEPRVTIFHDAVNCQ